MTAIPGQRATFHSRYVGAADRRDKRQKWPRLLEGLVCVVYCGDPRYLDPCDEREFAVVDRVTKEKAWFEMPSGATPEDVTGMIESTFAAPALRVDRLLWIV